MILASAAIRAPPSPRPVAPVHTRACTSVLGSCFYELLPEAAKHLVQVSHSPPVSATASRPFVYALHASIEVAMAYLEVPLT